ncbi:MAG: aldehyde dehydrogenase family protein [Polyangiaceae bacterium]|nr:aldehyde dehydrogenase family protein [Polyangiaceae bacterium]
MDDIPNTVSALRRAFDSGRTRPLPWRLRQLAGLRRFLAEREREIADALYADLGKPAVEGYGAEVSFVRGEIDYVTSKLLGWVRPERVRTPFIVKPGSSAVHKEPLGVVLVIGPWNYPLQLVISPLVGALAAGNCVVLKPSEIAAETSRVVARYLPEYADPGCVRVIEGGVLETTALLEQRFDHIFYTGNGAVGRIVMQAAANHLTPVTLELGGKSPCIVDASADLDVASRRIVWGKFFNAGQTCVAPDYVLVEDAIHDALVARMSADIRKFYGDDPRASPDYARVVNERHLHRLTRLLASGDVAAGGAVDETHRYIAPTILINVSPDSPVMEDEIFGPILPVLRVSRPQEAIAFVNARPKPLALYVFSSDKHVQQQVVQRTSSGGVTINHVWLHLAVPGLPFGGVGESGMGAYHGRASFDTFTHRKAVLQKTTAIDPPLFYPPYHDFKVRWLRRLLA